MSLLYGSEPPPAGYRTARRVVGAAVFALAFAGVLTLHVVRQQRAALGSVNDGFDKLAAGDLEAAESAFSRGIGGLSPDPIAMLGLAIADALPSHRDRAAPTPPPLAGLDERAAVDHGRRLLEHGLPQHALVWCEQARAVIGRKQSLGQVQLFAELWQRARKQGAPTATTNPPPSAP